MSWARLDDGFHSHPKVVALGKDLPALTLWVLGLSWCAHHKTDGILTVAAATKLVGPEHVNPWSRALLRVGLFKKTRGGFRYHDYHDYNFDRATITKRAADNRARQQRFRTNQQADHQPVNALVTRYVTRDVTGIPSRPDPTRPIPTPKRELTPTRGVAPQAIRTIAIAIGEGSKRNGHGLPPELVAQLHAAHPEKTPAEIAALFGQEAHA